MTERTWSEIGFGLLIFGWLCMTEPQLFYTQLPISPKTKNLIVRIAGAILFVAGIISFAKGLGFDLINI